MSDTYQPVPTSDEEYDLAVTSSKNMDRLDRLKLRAPCVGRRERKRVAYNYGFSTEDDEGNLDGALEEFGVEVPGDILPPAQFWEEAALVLFEGLDEVPENGIDFAEARRAMGKFANAGNEEYAEQLQNLSALLNSNDSGGLQEILQTT